MFSRMYFNRDDYSSYGGCIFACAPKGLCNHNITVADPAVAACFFALGG